MNPNKTPAQAFSPQGLLADQLRLAREEKGWSQQDLADRARMPQSQISKLERALIQDPSFFMVKDLAQILEMPLWNVAEFDGRDKNLHPVFDFAPHLIHGPGKDRYLLGKAEVNGESQDIWASIQELDKHLLIFGRSGTGKSVLCQNIATSIMENSDMPVIFVDPHGDSISQIADHVHTYMPDRVQDIVYLDLAQGGLAYNPLDVSHPHDIEPAVHTVMAAFAAQMGISGSSSPRAVNYLQQALTVLCNANLYLTQTKCTLLHVVQFFTDSQLRYMLLELCDNKAIQDAYDPEKGPFEMLSERQQMEHTMPVLRVFQPLGNSDVLANIFRHAHNRIDFKEIMQKRKIILIRCGRYDTARAASQFIGQMILAEIVKDLHAWCDRRDEATGKRVGTGARIIIDEAHTLLHSDNDAIITMLAEARKFNLGCVFSSQFPEQLNIKVMNALYANTGSKIVLSLDPAVAGKMDQAISGGRPLVTKQMISSLPSYHAYANMLMRYQSERGENATTSGPFFLKLAFNEETAVKHIKPDQLLKLSAKFYEPAAAAPERISYSDYLKGELATLIREKQQLQPPNESQSSDGDPFPWSTDDEDLSNFEW